MLATVCVRTRYAQSNLLPGKYTVKEGEREESEFHSRLGRRAHLNTLLKKSTTICMWARLERIVQVIRWV
jgi:hypothetical protein